MAGFREWEANRSEATERKGRDNHLVVLFAESQDNDCNMAMVLESWKRRGPRYRLGTTTICMPPTEQIRLQLGEARLQKV
ncbi:hypothetical protein [Paenibacillus tyrfis]|uniref:Uncharacterized protein n=1 Tax=Paenibacillus tyrfis TaxID=1501230 RepID=A0A081P4Y6_9BACL|nr:hypothetical protein [Paenibacillus tyrfis]KEQ25759.1 hypothetical protein ET33_03355 [Paenibacillus tyrfis]